MKNTTRFCTLAAMFAAAVCAHNAWAVAYTGKNDLSGGYTNNVDLAKGTGNRGVILLRDGNARFDGDCVFGNAEDTAAVLLMQGGSLEVASQILPWGSYFQFRKTGGNPCRFFGNRASDKLVSDVIPVDVVFGGSGVITGYVSYIAGPVNFAMTDDPYLSWPFSSGNGCSGSWIDISYGAILAFNGGHAVLNTTALTGGGPCGWTGGFYAFNGGILETAYGDSSAFGAYNDGNGKQSYRNVCVYEKGGGFINGCGMDGGNKRSTKMPAFREPEGNVVWSIPIPPEHELNSMTFEVPPSVIIKDSTGSGSNATAVVDWDYDTEKITNITVLCRGEAYSDTPGAVTANLRYRAGSKNYLLTTPLVCEVGPCQGGDVMFGGGYLVYFNSYSTNDYHGSTTIDMDMMNQYNTTNSEGYYTVGPYSGGAMSVLSYCQFPNTGSIILKSGMLYSGSTVSLNTLFPAATNLELYAGFVGRSQYSYFNTITVGGRVGLYSRSEENYSRLIVNDTLYVDPSCLTNGVVPALTRRTSQYSGLAFGSGAKIVLKNWETLPRGKKTLVLDLSVRKGMSGSIGTPTIIQSPDEGVLYWDSTEHQLYARRHSDGMMLIFK